MVELYSLRARIARAGSSIVRVKHEEPSAPGLAPGTCIPLLATKPILHAHPLEKYGRPGSASRGAQQTNELKKGVWKQIQTEHGQ